MKKISKLLSVVLCLAMFMSFALVASAEENQTAGFVASELGYENGTAVENIEGDVISFGFSDGGNSYGNCPKYYNSGSAIRFYNQNTFTVSVAAGYEIVSVVIDTDSSKPMNADNTALTNATAAYTDAQTVLTPEDGTQDVVMAYTPGSGHWRFTAVTVTYTTSDVEEVAPPAGPVDCEIPGTLTYTFASDDDASIGVAFRWTATADGELGVARMGETFMTNVLINGTYGEIGDYGYIVKAGDVVEIIVYGYGAGAVSVPVEFVTGEEDDDAVGTETNPEVVNANVEYVKTLESGEYFYQFTAAVAGEVVINTTGDGTHNMEVFVNGDATKIYSNWDNDGAFVKLDVAAGDVLTMKVYFDLPGAGTINFTVVAETAGVEPDPDPQAPIANGDTVMIYFPNGNSYISANANDTGKKLLEAAEAEAALWTVVVDENGYYTFICDGKYLTAGETGNSLTLEGAASDYSLWTLEEAENGWFVKNVNAAYNGSAQYLEYYSGFTTYGKKDTSDVALYTYQFVVVASEVEPNPNPGTGDAIFAVLSILAVSGMGITAVASKKH